MVLDGTYGFVYCGTAGLGVLTGGRSLALQCLEHGFHAYGDDYATRRRSARAVGAYRQHWRRAR
jgi:hypothetical protein